MATNSVENILKGAKDQLAKANKFTHSVEGDSTSAFAPPAAPKKIQGVKAAAPAHHELSDTPYGLAHELKAKQDNVDQYKKSVESNPNP